MKGLREKFQKNGGFTLIEMLIVVAIIAILIAVSIPLVAGALEKARDATDQANERAAKAAASIKYLGVEDGSFKEVTGTFYYDAVNGKLVDSASKPSKPYGQCTKNGNCYTGGSSAVDHTKSILKVTIAAGGTITLDWEAIVT